MSTTRTLAALAETVTAELDDTYNLVDAEHDRRLPTGVVTAIVNGTNPWETTDGDQLTEWESDERTYAAARVVDELAKEIVARWERETDTDYDNLLDEWNMSDERESVMDTVRDRDNSTWFMDLVTRHGPVLLRVGIETMSEDSGLSFTAITPAEFLDLLGFEHTKENLTLAAEAIDNASPEHSVVMGYALTAPDLDAIYQLPEDGKVELVNPHVWFGSPFTGSGWCPDEPFTGTLTVDRSDLRTDKDAFGHSWDEVAGGVSVSYFTGEIAAVPTTDTAADSTTDSTTDSGVVGGGGDERG